MEPDCTLRVIPPDVSQKILFQNTHDRVFGSHLSEVKVHGELGRHYWWKADITRRIRCCLICATHSIGQVPRPPLTPLTGLTVGLVISGAYKGKEHVVWQRLISNTSLATSIYGHPATANKSHHSAKWVLQVEYSACSPR